MAGEYVKGRQKISSPLRKNFSKRCASGKKQIIRKSYQYCHHHKAVENLAKSNSFGEIKCCRCKKVINK